LAVSARRDGNCHLLD